jgi:hypothetical protein
MVRGMGTRGLTWMSALRAGTAVGSAATDGVLFGFHPQHGGPSPTARADRRCGDATAALSPTRIDRSYAATASRMTTVPAWWDELTAFTAARYHTEAP